MTMELAIQHMQQGHWQQALDMFQQILEKDVTNEQALINSAIILSKSQHNKEAEKMLQMALVHHPQSALAIATLANIYYDQSRFKEAMTLYRRALILMPDDSNTIYMLGRSLLAIEQPKLAVAYLQRAYELAQEDMAIMMQLALCYCQLMMFDDAIPLLKKLTKIEAYCADAQYNLALSYYYKGERLQSIDLLEKNVAQYPEHLLSGYALKKIKSENI